jgi:fermentation-respiration switch protein FrsA (DUF1100 family)
VTSSDFEDIKACNVFSTNAPVRGTRMRQRVYSALVASLYLLPLTACTGVMRDRIYRPLPETREFNDLIYGFHEVAAKTVDGIQLRGRYWPPEKKDGDIYIFFPGNSGNLSTASVMADPLRRTGRGLLVASYRGYGDNPGRPNEAGLIADGAAFIQLASSLSPTSSKVLFGYSLGGAIAIEAATKSRFKAVVTLGAFTSLRSLVPFFAKPFLPDRFDNLAKVGRVNSPFYILHASEDEIVPFRQGQALRERAGSGSHLIRLEGDQHHLNFTRFADRLSATLDLLTDH